MPNPALNRTRRHAPAFHRTLAAAGRLAWVLGMDLHISTDDEH